VSVSIAAAQEDWISELDSRQSQRFPAPPKGSDGLWNLTTTEGITKYPTRFYNHVGAKKASYWYYNHRGS